MIKTWIQNWLGIKEVSTSVASNWEYTKEDFESLAARIEHLERELLYGEDDDILEPDTDEEER